MILRCLYVLAGAAALAVSPAHAQQYSGRLYQGTAPGSENWQYDVVTRDGEGGQARYNTRDPRVEVYLPDAGRANGAAVVMLPGGSWGFP